ncbi:MAG: glycosyltransferase family 2 protein [Planctomycetaceae bacterium]|nr:glycosyltransferase family 2 protein [Planctomycetaceae bacterium]
MNQPRREPSVPDPAAPPLSLFSIVIPARDEDGAITATVTHIHEGLAAAAIPHEIVIVDDGSTDRTWEFLESLGKQIPEVRPLQNLGEHGFGRAVICGLNAMHGDAVAIMMADDSDDVQDAIVYWHQLQAGYDCVFGSRFIRGGKAIDYPWFKWFLNRMANLFIKVLFRIRLNDTTNAFKAYRRTTIDGVRPILAPHFNLTVELPLKAIIRGYTWTVVPISWRNRKSGVAKLKIREMGSRYLFIVAYAWIERFFTAGDYHKRTPPTRPAN